MDRYISRLTVHLHAFCQKLNCLVLLKPHLQACLVVSLKYHNLLYLCMKNAWFYLELQCIAKSRINVVNYNCDQIWEKLPLTHKDKYLEIHNLIIQ